VESCVFRAADRRTRKLEIIDSFSLRSSKDYHRIRELDEEVSKDVWATGTLMIENELALSERFSVSADGLTSVMSMCLKSGDDRLGTISVYNKTSLDLFGTSRFSDADRGVFVNLCLQVSKAISRFVRPLSASISA
jgi:hypothetical protein